ncbi:MAG TPA: DUF3883 domain-containing protein [Baekduia sp.]|nr:DUF3883 domain-containing protein [Baekduia sp.]
MNTELQRVLELQPSWTWRNSVEMAQRGRLVRSDVAGWINDHAITFARALGALYQARTKAPLPDEVPELDDLEEATELAAGKRRSGRGAGFRQNKQERDLVGKHAEDMAAAHYVALGWSVRRVGAPYDLKLTRGTERWTVEVKGTTSEGQAIALTAGEVRHHRGAYPDNALVVVYDIVLDRSTSPPTVSGGVLHEHHPWTIDDEHLQVISYKYTVPDVERDLRNP